MPLGVTIAWIWIFVGALVSALGIFLAYRRAGLAAAYVYAGGLLILAASIFSVHPGLLRAVFSEQDGHISEKTKLMGEEQSGNAAAAACLGGKEKEVVRNEAFQARIDNYEAEIESYRNRLLLLSSSNKTLTAQLEAKEAEHRSALQSYQTQKTLLDANLAHLRLLQAEKAALERQLSAKDRQTAGPVTPAAQTKEEAQNLHAPKPAKQAGTVQPVLASSPKLDIKKLENSELVQGETGDYYLIGLKDAQTGSAIIFPPAKFVITEKAEQLHSALDELREAVLQRIPQDWQYRIFVRGHADGGSFKEPVGDDAYRNLEFLPQGDASGFSYRSQPVRKRLGREFENADLPNLRGMFIARTLHVSFKGEFPVLLGNDPGTGTNKAARRAEIILLLKRPNG
jgi:hypothetical protein